MAIAVLRRILSSVRSTIREWLRIPARGARVDPAAFPEDEYPVFCQRCGYELRGVSEGRCSECGQEFERGALLIEQYVRQNPPRTNARYRYSRWVNWTSNVLLAPAFAVMLVFSVLGYVNERFRDASVDFLVKHQREASLGLIVASRLMMLGLVGVALQIVSVWLLFSALPSRAKQKAVRDVWWAAHRSERQGRQR